MHLQYLRDAQAAPCDRWRWKGSAHLGNAESVNASAGMTPRLSASKAPATKSAMKCQLSANEVHLWCLLHLKEERAQKNGKKRGSFNASFTSQCQLFRGFRFFRPFLVFICRIWPINTILKRNPGTARFFISGLCPSARPSMRTHRRINVEAWISATFWTCFSAQGH